jgi:hypothetical protein
MTLAEHFLICANRRPSEGPYYLLLDEWIVLRGELEEYLAEHDDVVKSADSDSINFLLGAVEVRPR